MSIQKYYALACMSEKAVAKANEIKLNPMCYNYHALTDSRRTGMWLFVIVDSDGVPLFSKIHNSLDDILQDFYWPITVVN